MSRFSIAGVALVLSVLAGCGGEAQDTAGKARMGGAASASASAQVEASASAMAAASAPAQ